MKEIVVKDLSFSYHHNVGQKDGNRNGRRDSDQNGNRDGYLLKNLSFSIEDNETVGIIGANGVGKSTLLKLLVGLQTDYQGEIIMDGLPVTKKNLRKIREKVGYVFQDSDSQLFMATVYEDVAFAPRNYGLTEEEVDKRTMDALRSVHMEEFKHRHTYRLSGGEKKLASIATILSMRPDIILLDEPTVALDPKNRRNLIHVLNEIQAKKIITSHDLDLIYDTCERTILLANGIIVADGKTSEILKQKELLEANGLELPLSFSRSFTKEDEFSSL